jgi:hypothetical protein
MEQEKVFKVSKGFKIFFWVIAVLCILMVFMIPAGALLIYIISTGEVRMSQQSLSRKWIGTKTVPWNEITELKWLPALGALQRAMRQLRVVAKNPTKTVKFGIPVGCFERNEELIEELQKRWGKAILR